MSPKHSAEEEQAETPIMEISQRTPVRLGLVLAFSTSLLTAIGAFIALYGKLATLEAKFDLMNNAVQQSASSYLAVSNRQQAHEGDDMRMWTDIRARLEAIEKNGSDATRLISKELDQLENDFKVHEELQKKGALRP